MPGGGPPMPIPNLTCTALGLGRTDKDGMLHWRRVAWGSVEVFAADARNRVARSHGVGTRWRQRCSQYLSSQGDTNGRHG